MAPILLRSAMARMLLMLCLAVNWVSSSRISPQVAKTQPIEEACPPCELLFGKLERTGRNGKLVQDVRVQERGEPKSGTGLMYFWASAALKHACAYLQETFGDGSCQVIQTKRNALNYNHDELVARSPNHIMFFEPGLSSSVSRCPCDTIDRVLIVVSMHKKHELPVRHNCAFSHTEGIEMESPCTFADGTPVNNLDELWLCMHESNCDITDDWLQMGVYRDPRLVVVSTFYHAEVHSDMDLGNLDDFVIKELPIICQWLAVRYILFSGILAGHSTELWYKDATGDPLDWHYHWFYSVGLRLPSHIVEATTKAAVADDLGFNHKDFDRHPGEEPRTESGVRRFEDEVSPEILELADDVLRTWLPPVLLERFGVVP